MDTTQAIINLEHRAQVAVNREAMGTINGHAVRVKLSAKGKAYRAGWFLEDVRVSYSKMRDAVKVAALPDRLTMPAAVDFPRGVVVTVYLRGTLVLTDITGPVSEAEADGIVASYRERFQTASLVQAQENDNPDHTGTGVMYTKTEQLYTFEASRFYGPNEQYSSGSGLSVSGLSLEDAVRHVNTYRATEGHTYALSVVGFGDAVVYCKGVHRNDAKRSMNRAYNRRNGPAPAAPVSYQGLPGNERRMLKLFRTLTVEQQAEFFARVAADDALPLAARNIAADY